MRVLSKLCEHCGQPFTGTNAHGRTSWRRRRYCSVVCKADAQRGKIRATILTKSCEVCQRTFRNRRPNGLTVGRNKWINARYCSPQCRGLGMRGRAPHNKGHRVDLLEQFLRHVDKTSSETGCWLWTGVRGRAGYGGLQVGGKRAVAHRISYTLFKGPIPEGSGFHGTVVCHRCDNPSCVNPDHLFAGSHFANMRDRDEKGRRAALTGSAHGGAKLEERDVLAIRSMAKDYAQKELAQKFNVSVAMVSLIVNRKNWKHL